MSRFTAFFSRKARTTEAPVLIEDWRLGRPIYAETDYKNFVEHGWRRNALIYACISKTANTASQVGLEFLDAKGQPVANSRLGNLIKRPNPFMSEFDLWSMIVIFQKLAGVAYFEKQRTLGDEVIALWPLRPDWVTVTASETSPIDHYTYSVPGRPPKDLAPRDVLVFSLADPLGLYNRWPPVAVLAAEGEVDNSLTQLLDLIMKRGGVPPGLLTSEQKIDDEVAASTRRRWRERYGGFLHWLEPAVLGSGAKYQAIGSPVKDLGIDILDERNESRICMVLEIPPIVVGAKAGLARSTFANYAEARLSWWQDSIIPMYENHLDVIGNQLVPDFPRERLTAVWNFDRVAALQENRQLIWSRAKDAFTSGGMTLNEYRVAIGLSSFGPAGEFYMLGTTVVQVGTNPWELPPPAPEPEPEPEEEVISEVEDEDEDTEEEAEPKTYFLLDLNYKGVGSHPNASARSHDTDELEASLVSAFNRKKEALISEVQDALS